jgi:hypothetical protein
MQLATKVDEERKIFIVQVTGRYRRPQDGFEIQRFVIQSVAEHGCEKVLIDLRAVEIVAGILSTYETANPEPSIAHELRKYRYAFLYAEISENERFFETAGVNRGYRMRVSEKLAKAVEWLEK